MFRVFYGLIVAATPQGDSRRGALTDVYVVEEQTAGQVKDVCIDVQRSQAAESRFISAGIHPWRRGVYLVYLSRGHQRGHSFGSDALYDRWLPVGGRQEDQVRICRCALRDTCRHPRYERAIARIEEDIERNPTPRHITRHRMERDVLHSEWGGVTITTEGRIGHGSGRRLARER